MSDEWLTDAELSLLISEMRKRTIMLRVVEHFCFSEEGETCGDQEM